LAVAALGVVVKGVLSVVIYSMPVLGFWLASSLMAYRGGATWVPLVAGLVAFPVAPLAWDAFSEYRRNERGDARPRILTFGDRILLRTFAITFTLIALLLMSRPDVAFVALSTRGDWMLDGRHGGVFDRSRRVLFGAAQGLEWLYLATHKNRFEDLVDDDAKTHGEPKPGTGGKPVPVPRVTSSAAPAPAPPASADVPPTPPHMPSMAGIKWPLDETLHSAVTEMPAEAENSYEHAAAYLRDSTPAGYQRIKALHDFIADRIVYDIEALADKRMPAQDAHSVYAARKGVCAGYANLFKAMADVTGDEVAVVVGDARSDIDDVDGVGHAWNAAKIDGKWFLIDVTWDAGSSSGKNFNKRYSTEYLFPPAEVFGMSHFPETESWQLRDRPLTRGEFMRQPMLEARFFLRGFRLLRPDRSQVPVSDRLDVELYNPNAQFVMAKFTPKGAGGPESNCDVKPGRQIAISCAFAKDGLYRMLLFAGAQPYGRYQHIATFEAVRR
jgi:hypothetical protein